MFIHGWLSVNLLGVVLRCYRLWWTFHWKFHGGVFYWIYVGGAVWFRNSTFQSTNERALTDIQRVYPSVSYIDQILIVTWDRLHLLSQNYQVAS